MGVTVLDAGVVIALLERRDVHRPAARSALADARDRGDRIILPASAYSEALVGAIFLDGGIAAYAPSVYEIALGLGGVGIALLMVALAVKVLPVLPETFADAVPAK